MPEQRLVFPCPACGVALHLRLLTPNPPSIELSSEDVRVDRPHPEDGEDLPVVVLYADLPIPTSFLDGTAPTFASPFIEWTRIWGGRAVEYTSRSHAMHGFRTGVFPQVRRATSLLAMNQVDKLAAALRKLPLEEVEGLQGLHPVYILGRVVDLLFLPAGDVPLRTAAVNELLKHMVACYKLKPSRYRGLLELLSEEAAFGEHRRKVATLAMSMLDRIDALLPGLAWEHVSSDPPPAPEDFRIVRDDFDELRGRFVDAFELGSRSLCYVGAVVNLAMRDDPNSWANGNAMSVPRMLRKKAHQREFILNELPFTALLHKPVPRKTRNDFGHYAVEYDVSTGELVSQDGKRKSFLLFLVEYLEAARLVSYLFGVVEKLTLDMLDVHSPHREVADAEDWPSPQ